MFYVVGPEYSVHTMRVFALMIKNHPGNGRDTFVGDYTKIELNGEPTLNHG
jgi:hypothetical protein